MRKIFLSLILSTFLFFPTISFAGTYQLEDGTDVCYEGLVPCGKEVQRGVVSNSDGTCPTTGTTVDIPCQLCHFFIMFKGIIDFVLLSLIFPIAVLMLVIAGIMFFLASGDPAKLSKATAIIKSVVIGLAIIFGAWIIVNTFFSIMGFEQWTGLNTWWQIKCDVITPTT